jgi:hypothetical protein
MPCNAVDVVKSAIPEGRNLEVIMEELEITCQVNAILTK